MVSVKKTRLFDGQCDQFSTLISEDESKALRSNDSYY